MSGTNARDGLTLLLKAARGQMPTEAIGETDEQAIVRRCRADVRARTLKIEAHVARSAYRPARREGHQLRRCLAGRLNALWASLPDELKDDRRRAEDDRAQIRALRWRALVLGLSTVEHLDRPSTARLTARPKGSRSATGERRYRPVYSFDWLDLAKQRLIATSITPFVDLHPSQYMLRQLGKRGRSAVRETLLERLPLMGPDQVFVQLDVKGFHQNINHEWLEESLPGVSKGIIRSHGHTGGMIHAPVKDKVKARLGVAERGAYENFNRRGIPTGSALSALIGEYVMAEVLRRLADQPQEPLLFVHYGDLHTYSDNLGVFVDRTRAEAVVDLLKRAFSSSPAGPFELRAMPSVPAHGPFKFLGHWFRAQDGAAEAYVPEHIAERRMEELLQDLLTAQPAELMALRRKIEGVAADWKYWEGSDTWRAEALAQVASAEGAFGSFDRLAA